MMINWSAVALKIYFIVVCLPIAIKVLPLPGTLQEESNWYGVCTIWLIILGCVISLFGIFKKDRLDGSIIEQVGLTSMILGFLMYSGALVKALPMSAFPMVICGGFAVFFLAQWIAIWKWRRPLRDMARSHGA
jgi:hypothetical protein